MKLVKLYTTGYCPYCTKAKDLLISLGVSFEEIDVENNTVLREELSEKFQWRTVPMIVAGDRFIGGFDDLKKLHDSGELMSIVNSK